MRVVVFGGRRYGNVEMFKKGTPEREQAFKERQFIHRKLTELSKEWPQPIEVISGMAGGVDRVSAHWAANNSYKVHRFYADWQKLKKAAGPIRNQQMIDEGYPELAVAFPGGKGTADMEKRCRDSNLKIVYVPPF